MRLGNFLSYQTQIFSHWFSHVCTSFYFYPDEVWKKKSFSAHPNVYIYTYIVFSSLKINRRIPTTLRRLRKSSLSLWYMQFRRKWRGNGFRRVLKILLYICYSALEVSKFVCLRFFYLHLLETYKIYTYESWSFLLCKRFKYLCHRFSLIDCVSLILFMIWKTID